MTARASTLLDQVTTRPVSAPLELTSAAADNLPVPLFPPAGGRVLFAVADRLVDGMHEAARGKGTYAGFSPIERTQKAMPLLGVGLVIASSIGFGVGLPGHDTSFLGFIAGLVACIPAGLGIEMLAAGARQRPIHAGVAQPYLSAFKSGDREVQAIVRRLAADAATTMTTHMLGGDKLRAQLDEIAAVAVDLEPAAASRVQLICELACAVPRRERQDASCDAVLQAFEKLDPADRADIASQLMSHLFFAGRLRWKVRDPENAEALRAALEGRKTFTSRDELQGLVRK